MHDRTAPNSISKTIPSRRLDYTERTGREKDVCHDFLYRGHTTVHNCISATTWKVRLRDGPLTHVRSYKLILSRSPARTHTHIYIYIRSALCKSSESNFRPTYGGWKVFAVPFSPFWARGNNYYANGKWKLVARECSNMFIIGIVIEKFEKHALILNWYVLSRKSGCFAEKNT